MRSFFGIAATITAVIVIPTTALAKDTVVQAIQVGYETVRYDKGMPTLDLEQRAGAVQIHPLPMDHGSFVFAIAVFNDGNAPANMDIGNIAVHLGDQPIGIMDVNHLIKKAKNRSFWSQFGVAMLGGVASAAAASERNTYHGTFSTPYATYHSYYSAPSLAGQLRAARIEDQTAASIVAMRAQLDATRDALGDQIIQMTTVDPGRMYAGKIILEKFKASKLPQQLSITVNWNGEQYPFVFQLAEAGTPAPYFTPTVRERPTAAPRPERQPSGATPIAGPVPNSRSAIPPNVDMERIVKRTAEVMPRPFALESGTALVSYEASGTELIVTADAAPSVYDDSSSWEQAAYAEICMARPFASILNQGGVVRATYLGQRKTELGTVVASRETCRYPRRS